MQYEGTAVRAPFGEISIWDMVVDLYVRQDYSLFKYIDLGQERDMHVAKGGKYG